MTNTPLFSLMQQIYCVLRWKYFGEIEKHHKIAGIIKAVYKALSWPLSTCLAL